MRITHLLDLILNTLHVCLISYRGKEPCLKVADYRTGKLCNEVMENKLKEITLTTFEKNDEGHVNID